ncbi:MAG: hypothetical protein COV67_12545 [Nitrospinae bacterium CG11_big_fil_rev_8_21_14_0_20_56_8]|nr:MAG: hypothetical protein COV67_12545 [Nitrospinae bacterium CG11_big_fil_rev_8_21_14_0_20_56_8]
MAKKLFCPRCRSEELIPILYGYPESPALDKALRGEIELGGCLVSEGNPTWKCKACGLPFSPETPADGEPYES